MEWINLHTSFLDSPEFLGAEPVDRATWICLLRYCIGQENGGVIVGASDWGDRKWQQLVRVTLREVRRDSALWSWLDDRLEVFAYPLDKELQVKSARVVAQVNGTKGGRPKKPILVSDDKPRSVISEKAEGEGKDKGKEVEGEANPPPPPNFLNQQPDSRTAALMAESLQAFGIPNGPGDLKDWIPGIRSMTRIRDRAEFEFFLGWMINVARKEKVVVQRWRHASQYAQRWEMGGWKEVQPPKPKDGAL